MGVKCSYNGGRECAEVSCPDACVLAQRLASEDRRLRAARKQSATFKERWRRGEYKR